eukprot:TRINITY_DN41542_c0_g1_i1.p1 TRINITY_DN41542_c0_g1~~TRINITY_DN41542_c0_g1_i1.p1  ORF type:complete len:984 (-),score=73.26 TRINITY_DN41542_c0_g1_i1:146-3028(-)
MEAGVMLLCLYLFLAACAVLLWCVNIGYPKLRSALIQREVERFKTEGVLPVVVDSLPLLVLKVQLQEIVAAIRDHLDANGFRALHYVRSVDSCRQLLRMGVHLSQRNALCLDAFNHMLFEKPPSLETWPILLLLADHGGEVSGTGLAGLTQSSVEQLCKLLGDRPRLGVKLFEAFDTLSPAECIRCLKCLCFRQQWALARQLLENRSRIRPFAQQFTLRERSHMLFDVVTSVSSWNNDLDLMVNIILDGPPPPEFWQLAAPKGYAVEGSTVFHTVGCPHFCQKLVNYVPRENLPHVLNSLDNEGGTPLSCASCREQSRQNIALVQVLLTHGAHPRSGPPALWTYWKSRGSSCIDATMWCLLGGKMPAQHSCYTCPREYNKGMLRLHEVRFSQHTISDEFQDGKTFDDTIAMLRQLNPPPVHDYATVNTSPIRTIKVAWHEGRWYSMDNRRLYCFKAVFLSSSTIPVLMHSRASYGAARFDSKFSTRNMGESVNVVRTQVHDLPQFSKPYVSKRLATLGATVALFGTSPPRCSFRGIPETLQRARDLLHQILADFCVRALTLDARLLGQVVGQRGSNLKALEASTGTDIVINGSIANVAGSRTAVQIAVETLEETGKWDTKDSALPKHAKLYLLRCRRIRFREVTNGIGGKVDFINDSVLRMSGSRRQVREAVAQLSRWMQNFSSVVVALDPKLVGHVIGSGGANIKRIEDTTGAVVHVDGAIGITAGSKHEASAAEEMLEDDGVADYQNYALPAYGHRFLVSSGWSYAKLREDTGAKFMLSACSTYLQLSGSRKQVRVAVGLLQGVFCQFAHEHVQLDAALVGRVIGPQGRQLKALEASSGAFVDIKGCDANVFGRRSCVEAAVRDLEDNGISETTNFAIPEHGVGVVRGRENETIKGLEAITGAKLRVMNCNDSGPFQTHAIVFLYFKGQLTTTYVRVSGTRRQVRNACSALTTLLRDF